MKRIAVTLFCVLLSGAVLAQAADNQKVINHYGGIACGQDPILPTDGSQADDYVTASGAGSWFYIHAKKNHSYSVEVWDPYDGQVIASSATLAVLATDCTTPVATTNVTTVDPDLSNNFGARLSWIQGSQDADLYIQVTTSDATNGNSYLIRVTDTTLLNPRWSTFSGYQTQYSFVNNTSTAINGTLTVYDNAGVVVSSKAVAVPAGAEDFEGFSTPVNKFGFATFAYVGPPGAVTADAYFLNLPNSVVPSVFAPRNYQH